MAFKTAGDSSGVPENSGQGLPLSWNNLRDGCCPKCGDELVSFDHLDLFKCVCGFKITAKRMNEILNAQEDRVYNGFGVSPYDWDNPF